MCPYYDPEKERNHGFRLSWEILAKIQEIIIEITFFPRFYVCSGSFSSVVDLLEILSMSWRKLPLSLQIHGLSFVLHWFSWVHSCLLSFSSLPSCFPVSIPFYAFSSIDQMIDGHLTPLFEIPPESFLQIWLTLFPYQFSHVFELHEDSLHHCWWILFPLLKYYHYYKSLSGSSPYDALLSISA